MTPGDQGMTHAPGSYAPADVFRRDRFTWLAYFMLGYFAYMQAIIGPMLPFLRETLNLNYTAAGFHFSAFAVGTSLGGMVVDRTITRWGRRLAFWGGGFGIAGGGLVMVFAPTPFVTVPGALVMGFMSAFQLAAIQATISDHHPAFRAIALTEANVMASLLAGFAPMIVGGAELIGLGWRTGMWSMALAGVVAYVLFRDVTIPERHKRAPGTPQPDAPLPRVFWIYWVTMVMTIGIEWSVALWGAEYLVEDASMPKASASIFMSAFFLAAVIGRMTTSRLMRSMRLSRLLTAAMLIGFAGFLLFWQAGSPVPSVIGLFVVGLGISNFYPLLLSITTGLAPEQVDRVSGYLMLGVGASMLAFPQALGALADQLSLREAYGLVTVLFVLAFAGAQFADRWSTRHNLG